MDLKNESRFRKEVDEELIKEAKEVVEDLKRVFGFCSGLHREYYA